MSQTHMHYCISLRVLYYGFTIILAVEYPIVYIRIIRSYLVSGIIIKQEFEKGKILFLVCIISYLERMLLERF